MILSGVSHDLRTPLTRLKLGLSMNDDTAENGEMLTDLDEMERLIDSFLEFVRSDATEAAQLTDPVEIIRQLIGAAARAGKPVTIGTLPETVPDLCGPSRSGAHSITLSRTPYVMETEPSCRFRFWTMAYGCGSKTTDRGYRIRQTRGSGKAFCSSGCRPESGQGQRRWPRPIHCSRYRADILLPV